MKSIFQRFSSPKKVCGMPRFHCAAWTVFGVRHAPFLLCDMLRFMQGTKDGHYK